MAVKYLSTYHSYTLVDSPVEKRGMMGLLPGQEEDGYGSEITTDKMAVLSNGKKYRVYCTQYSNAGSYWIKYLGEKLFL